MKMDEKKSDYDDLEIGVSDDNDLEIGEPIRRDIPLRGRRPPPEDLEPPGYAGSKKDEIPTPSEYHPRPMSDRKYNPTVLITAVAIIVMSSLLVYFIITSLTPQITSQNTDVKISLDNERYSVGNIAIITLKYADANASPAKPEEVVVSVFNINTRDQINLKLEKNETKPGEFNFSQKFNLAKVTNEELHNIKVNDNDIIMVIYHDAKKMNNPPRYANTTAIAKII